MINLENDPMDTMSEDQGVSSPSTDTDTSSNAANAVTTPRPKQRRGFAAMDKRLVSEIASKGGIAAHAAGTAHEFSAQEARDAGRKGGLAPHTPRRVRRAAAGEPKDA